LKGLLEYQEKTLVHLIHVQEGLNPTLFWPWGEDNKRKKIYYNLETTWVATFSFCF
jgi:hypothetical protein